MQTLADAAPSFAGSLGATPNAFGAGIEAGADASGAAGGAGLTGKVLSGAGAAIGAGLGIASVAQQANLSDSEKAALSAAEAARAVGSVFSFGASSIAEILIQAFGGPSPNQFLSDLFGFGPSKAWQSFPGRVMQTIAHAGSIMSDAAQKIAAATSPTDLQAAIDEANSQIKGMPGTWGEQTLDTVGGLAASMSQSAVHGATLPDLSAFQQVQEGLRQLIAAKSKVFAAQQTAQAEPPPSPTPPRPPFNPDAPAAPSMPPRPPFDPNAVIPGGPAGALGFSRDVLQAA